MTVRVQVVFEEETMDAVVAAVRRWLDGSSGGQAPGEETSEAQRAREVREVLAAIRGLDSRRLVQELAEAASRGAGIRLDDTLKARYGKATGTAFAGVVGGVNKLSRRLAQRDLIARDTTLGGYRMDPRDAEVVFDAWAQPKAAGQEGTRGGKSGIRSATDRPEAASPARLTARIG